MLADFENESKSSWQDKQLRRQGARERGNEGYLQVRSSDEDQARRSMRTSYEAIMLDLPYRQK
jgi:hypothetical protein